MGAKDTARRKDVEPGQFGEQREVGPAGVSCVKCQQWTSTLWSANLCVDGSSVAKFSL